MSNTENKESETKHSCCNNKKAHSGDVTANKGEAQQGKVDALKRVNADEAEEHHLIIDGASCASCVTKIEKALRAVKGVKSAEMNFAQRSVIVTGNVEDASLITAVEIAGYNAKVDTSGSEEEALDEKDRKSVV